MIALAITFALLGLWDVYVTKLQIARHGIEYEPNHALRWLVRKLGPKVGVPLGILFPAANVLAFVLYFKLALVLSFLTGMRFMLALLQFNCLRGYEVSPRPPAPLNGPQR